MAGTTCKELVTTPIPHSPCTAQEEEQIENFRVKLSLGKMEG